MNWRSLIPGRKQSEPMSAAVPNSVLEVPLFPIGGVLFPGGRLSLKVYEQRYLDMAAACMRDKTPFAACLIESGHAASETAVPHIVGTLAHIDIGDMPQLGILMLHVHGERRFRIVSHETQSDGLVRCRVELIEESPRRPVPEALRGLLPLLLKVVSDLGPERIPLPHDYDDAAWVGYRLSEIAPVQPLAKQKLLELTDPVSRLEILHTYYAQHQLI